MVELLTVSDNVQLLDELNKTWVFGYGLWHQKEQGYN
jgi:hypothetical protein